MLRDTHPMLHFGRLLERLRPKLDEEVRRAAIAVPVFAEILASMPRDPADEAHSWHLQRHALFTGEWSAYVAYLQAMGRTFADKGVTLADWFRLLASYRRIVVDDVLGGDIEEAHRVLSEMDLFLDRVMAALGMAYVDRKQELLRAAHTELERRMRELEASNRELDAFAYIASHDLKAPLRDIVNLAGWIAEDAGDVLPPASARHLAKLRDRITRMERLLDDLLDYSRAGRVAGATEKVLVAAIVDEAQALAGPRDGFLLEVHGGETALVTPRAPLVQVLRNLISNAVKHHHRGYGVIRVAARNEGERVHFEVSDDGPGIPKCFHDRVFAMFQTLKPRDQIEGSGIGLAIVKKLIEVHGGRVELTSREGEGTTVAFTWPARYSAPAAVQGGRT